MFDERDSVKTFRGRANHARLGMEETNSPALKEVLRKLAVSYDAKADEAELAERDSGPI
jgi:hypothetical protein